MVVCNAIAAYWRQNFFWKLSRQQLLKSQNSWAFLTLSLCREKAMGAQVKKKYCKVMPWHSFTRWWTLEMVAYWTHDEKMFQYLGMRSVYESSSANHSSQFTTFCRSILYSRKELQQKSAAFCVILSQQCVFKRGLKNCLVQILGKE